MLPRMAQHLAAARGRVASTRAWRAFARTATEKPFLASGFSSSVTLGLVDVGTQRLTRDEPWDGRRTLSMVLWGAFWYGGPQQFFYTRLYPRLIGEGTSRQAAMKVFADCVLNSLFAYVPCFYIFTGMVKGQSFWEAVEVMRSEYFVACFGMNAFWVPVQFVNFYFVPIYFQTYVVSIANIVNKSWLSWFSNRDRADGS